MLQCGLRSFHCHCPLVPARGVSKDRPVTEAELAVPPSGYPSSTAVFRRHEGRALQFISAPFGDGISFYERTTTAMKESDAISIRTCREIEGNLCDYIGTQYGKTNLPNRPGLELTGLPFLVALKPPTGAATIEEALPEGFKERVGGRGSGSWRSLMNDCQIVLVPHLGDQILNTRVLAGELQVAVEVEREENGWFSKESLCKAIKSVMDEESEVGGLVRKNHASGRRPSRARLYEQLC
ncbi:UDP-glycosyltransferase 79B6 [Vitis vinifera]|uniref:UDP-glycosyltransferase 79B6 n=1 Tax=Vitis vinifera TaxID=29760 RepID=A0A438C4A5_VITVI|nr:UDP-glycosyltransferase 79B6 [Vitis vinifera]